MARKQTRTAFILSFATSIPAKDVVVAAKKQGWKLSEKYVYNVRSSHRKGRTKAGRAAVARGTPKQTASVSSDRVHTAIAELGSALAELVLQDVKSRFGI